MNLFGILGTLIAFILVLQLPRNLASIPLLLGAIYITRTQQLEVGPMHLPAMRLLIFAGMLRISMKSERISGGMNALDRMMRLWIIWDLCTIPFHVSDEWIFRLGVLYDIAGAYFLFRVFITGFEDVRTIFKNLCFFLLPLAMTMLVEKQTGTNPLALVGFGASDVAVTNGHFRAAGAFAHPILAGTAGAVCVPMAIYFWRKNRSIALIGLFSTLGIVFASGSSGPIMTTLAGFMAMGLWLLRDRLKVIRWLAVLLIFFLSLVMNDPVYYLMARIDITGGSTGYFRAQLIQSTINHFSEWWFAGTDHTRHWMPSGITANANHTDMTNYYIQMGVWGGLILVILFAGLLYCGYVRVGKSIRANANGPSENRFLCWTLGSILFAHTTTFFSISYFDQTIILLCLALACIGSLPLLRQTANSSQRGQPPRPAASRISPRRVPC
jgi:hypothetical protein